MESGCPGPAVPGAQSAEPMMRSGGGKTMRQAGEAQRQEDMGEVQVLTSETFGPAVFGGHSALVVFMAPWCGHCRALEPVLTSVARQLRDDGVAVCKLDATANEFPADKFAVEFYPSIFFVSPAGDRFKYQGKERTDTALVNFARELARGADREPPMLSML